MDTSSLSRKEREKLQRKKEILAAATNLFAKKGYRETTLEDIAAEAEFGTGTLYNYIASKEDIFRNILKQLIEDSIDHMNQYVDKDNDFKSFLREYLIGLFDHIGKNKEGIKLVMSFYTSVYEPPVSRSDEELDNLHRQMHEIMTRRIDKAIKAKELKAYEPNMLRYYIDSLVYPYLIQLLREEHDTIQHPNVHIDFIMDVLMGGIQNEKLEK